MIVLVALADLNPPELAEKVRFHITDRWGSDAVFIHGGVQLPRDAESLLIVGNDGFSGEHTPILFERIRAAGPLEETLFQVDAKLGRMTRSDLALTKTPISSEEGRKISRRDLFNFSGGIAAYSDAPFVFRDTCDAKLGCSKCVDVCPAKSLSIHGGAVVVNSADCVRCGLCAETCPTSAIQLPRFSEAAFLGLIDGLNCATAPKKTLVLTCNKEKVEVEPWMCVEEVKDVGVVGPRHLALAASSSLGAVVVYCANGTCYGREKARRAVETVRSISKEGGTILAYTEDPNAPDDIRNAHALSRPPKPSLALAGKTWESYTSSLKSIGTGDASASGLGLTTLEVSDSCTLCNVCGLECPHNSVGVRGGRLEFNPETCTGCGHCASICPEDAIRLTILPSLSALRVTTVSEDQMVPCARCGKPLESARFLKKVAAVVGKKDPMMKYCPTCKQKVAFELLLKQQRNGGST